MKKLGNNRAISPVIATVILVAVAITVAVAVAYWMGNIAGTYTAAEKIEMPSSYAIYSEELTNRTNPSGGNETGWKVFIQLKNSGSRDATITNLFLNEIPIKDYMGNVTLYVVGVVGEQDLTDISVPVPKGEEAELTLWIYSGTGGCSSGTTIDLKINSAAGNKYPVMVKLP